MNWRSLAGILAVAGVVLGVVGTVLALATRNDLLTGSDWQTPAIVVLGLVAVVAILLAVIGTPFRGRLSTPYW